MVLLGLQTEGMPEGSLRYLATHGQLLVDNKMNRRNVNMKWILTILSGYHLCKICGWKFYSFEGLQKHMELHTKEVYDLYYPNLVNPDIRDG